MALTDGDIAALARQAVDLLDPEIDVAIDPSAGDDPYRWGQQAWTVWPLVDGERSFSAYVDSGETPVDALGRLVDSLSENTSETARYWGVAFPACLPGHRHPADVRWYDPDHPASDDPPLDHDAVTLRCPLTGETVTRLVPDLPR